MRTAYFAWVTLICTVSAHAQWHRSTAPIDQPGWGLTAPDGPYAIDLDPAALAFLPSWGFGYLHADSGETEIMERGDGFYAATPILFGIAGGVSVNSVRPTLRLGEAQRTMISLALAYALNQSLGAGAAVRFLASGDARLAGVTTLDLSASWRPVEWLALSFMARDVVGPRLGGTDQSVPRSFVLSTALRPLSDRTLTIDAAGVIDENGRIGARTALEVSVPYIGRLLAALEAEGLDGRQPSLRGTAGLSLDWTPDFLGLPVSAGGGVRSGDGFENAPGWYVSAGVEGAERPGIPHDSFVLDVELGGQSGQGMVRTIRRLDRALNDARVAGVLLRMRGSGIGLAYAQEIRMMVRALRERGKRVVCHLDDAAGSEWYACAGADRVLLDPAGGVRLAGVSSELWLLGDVLHRAGIRADFVRIGPYKSAIEEYLNSSQSRTARAQRDSLLDASYRRLVFDSAQDLEVPEARMREIIDRGPHLPDAARELGLVDAFADELDMSAELRIGFDGSYARERGDPWDAPARWGAQPKIGVVVLEGTMVDGDDVDVPLIGIHMSGGRTIARAIDSLASDPEVVAIVLRVDSPGGSVLAADQIHRAILRARERKPVIASFGSVAASGGYYAGCAAHEIWADPSTLTGSIGIWFGKVDFVPLAEMIGVRLEQMGRGAHAGATSFYRPFTPEERAVLVHAVREWYLAFLRRVARGRHMTVAQVDALARGRVYSGDQALANGLVDHLGGFQSALTAARRAAQVGDDVDILVVPHRPSTLLDYALSALGLGVAPSDGPDAGAQGNLLARIAPELQAALQAVFTMRELENGAPLALMEDVPIPR